ncbi:FMN-binding protein [Streptomyces sp. NPDC054842]
MKKSHPIRRVVLATAATVSGIVLLLSLKPASDPAAASAGGAPQQSVAGRESPQGGGEQQSSQARTVTGDAATTQYGPVQVRLTLADGKITKAEAVQAPSGGRSTQITGDAVPRLNRETVTTGTADIDTVTGATYTSTGYKQSLQSALDKAGSTGGGAPASKAPAAQARTVTGDAATTQYGPVQVRLTLADGKITKAEAVQAPSGGRSTQITGDAVPRLNRETVTTGTADIDTVTGATYTSTGYKQSLQSALDKAGG